MSSVCATAATRHTDDSRRLFCRTLIPGVWLVPLSGRSGQACLAPLTAASILATFDSTVRRQFRLFKQTFSHYIILNAMNKLFSEIVVQFLSKGTRACQLPQFCDEILLCFAFFLYPAVEMVLLHNHRWSWGVALREQPRAFVGQNLTWSSRRQQSPKQRIRWPSAELRTAHCFSAATS